jgi:hypothetical protein
VNFEKCSDDLKVQNEKRVMKMLTKANEIHNGGKTRITKSKKVMKIAKKWLMRKQ